MLQSFSSFFPFCMPLTDALSSRLSCSSVRCQEVLRRSRSRRKTPLVGRNVRRGHRSTNRRIRSSQHPKLVSSGLVPLFKNVGDRPQGGSWYAVRCYFRSRGKRSEAACPHQPSAWRGFGRVGDWGEALSDPRHKEGILECGMTSCFYSSLPPARSCPISGCRAAMAPWDDLGSPHKPKNTSTRQLRIPDGSRPAWQASPPRGQGTCCHDVWLATLRLSSAGPHARRRRTLMWAEMSTCKCVYLTHPGRCGNPRTPPQL